MDTTAGFDFIENQQSKDMYIDAYSAITKLDLWDWLSQYVPEKGKGFMFGGDPNIATIYGALQTSHTGATFAIVMRGMEHIAKHGYQSFADINCL